MLSELRVKNLALIESLNLSFDQTDDSGLIVMTGETGAGKSIMLRAIHLLSGQRATADWVRNGADSCVVEALFHVNPAHAKLLEKLEKGGFGTETSLVIKRVLLLSGRSRYYVNGSLATARIVSEFTAELLNIASQHDHQQLLQANLHLDCLDTIGDHWPLRREVTGLYRKWTSAAERLAALIQKEQEKEKRQDFLRFQVEEIRKAELSPGEDEQLAAEKLRLKNGQSLVKLSQASLQLLSGELMDGLGQLRHNVVQLAVLDPQLHKFSEEVSGFTFIAEDYANELRAYRDSLESDPYRQDQVNERLDLLQQLKRKYGETIEEILEFAGQGELELQQLENMDREIALGRKEVEALEQEMCGAAGELSRQRRNTAGLFEKAMVRELASLSFDRAQFQVRFRDLEETAGNIGPAGWDRCEFFFTANPGEPVKPLVKVASGGELSRLMLALKCLLARKDMVETVIFDEVDAGIGGEAAEAVARKIKELSTHHQVFCITHLPQIAARGNLHFQVQKSVGQERTQSSVVRLNAESRVLELVRMLAGDSATTQTRAWAEELLVKGGAPRG